MRSDEIRKRFLGHFERTGHTVVPSASLVADDPTLLLVNAGMVPFKPYFLGEQPTPWAKATSVQKCVRTLDIDEVGKTTRHGSFFQMAGNFSFGDYFKQGAIEYAYDLCTRPQADGGYGLEESKIWPTVFLDDDEAFDLWRKVGVPEERIQRLGLSENYWHMGVPGPGGPCSEINYDRGSEYGAEGGPAVNGERYLEIWNLVFMQYQLSEVRSKVDFDISGPLPKQNIDTGMGLERVAALLQGVDNLYEIDTSRMILDKASELTGAVYGRDHAADVRMRVVADHARTALMLIGDGVTPNNEGRGYILRRILRRTTRAMILLGAPDPTMAELMQAAHDAMSPQYPSLDLTQILRVAVAEEGTFLETVTKGATIFDQAVPEARSAGGVLSGTKAFQLHDTYGFPIDLTLEMAAEQGLTVDEQGFRALMAEQKSRAREATLEKRGKGGDLSVFGDLLGQHGLTDWLAYETLETSSKVLAVLVDGILTGAAGEGAVVQVALDRTPFYAESGGQVADAGTLVWDGGRAEVLDVQRPVKGLVVHQVRVLDGELVSGAELQAVVDLDWRRDACQAHSGTHVVHAALRQVLGPNALQSGSYNRPGYLRLDFGWQGALSPEQRSDIERVSNTAVRDDLSVSAQWMTLPEAREFGALALFGETYGEKVRVVEIGGPWSRELCGGTHVRSSAQIGPLVVTGESSVGSGNRRIEAIVGLEAFGYLSRERDLVAQLTAELKTPASELPARISDMVTRMRDAEKELATLRAGEVLKQAGELAKAAKDVFGLQYVGVEAPAGTPGDLVRSLALDIRGRLTGPGAVLVAAGGERVTMVACVNPAGLARGLSANDVLREAASAVDGKGGGKDDIAQGGGTNPDGIGRAIELAEHLVGRVATASAP
ncbi:MAG: alaS [Frankiales bacterium]|nr:alaS [Frankiales bacterium]